MSEFVFFSDVVLHKNNEGPPYSVSIPFLHDLPVTQAEGTDDVEDMVIDYVLCFFNMPEDELSKDDLRVVPQKEKNMFYLDIKESKLNNVINNFFDYLETL